ncbi:MAG: hypothetical protein DWQ31_11160 [Planctomycetota bacterium]|nr:MAG: hypothetical protein DWQ31_11160 [Planctomycetota bacterium]REJ94437.1 MAG: hypothetical protein DWQ35_08560 [Planctomycetota bacterium]REK22028.1 MAG: hypothetical protein DWQ42_17965 [Planctomycetota bacterium]REK44436.1 MAG: hypothetical protein DWQ46_09250 [Planctomycetota bacterium]
MKQCLELRLARRAAWLSCPVPAWLVVLLLICQGCSKPPAKTVLPEVGPPEITPAAVGAVAEPTGEDDGDAATTAGAEEGAGDGETAGDEQRPALVTKPLDAGLVATPISAYFGVKAKIQRIQIDQALRLYKSTNGRLPSDHDEFLREIIVANKIELPPLKSGETYRFDPDEGDIGTLMIVSEQKSDDDGESGE